ncbi:MAG: hypothetical protein AB1442_08975 [Nitrospirota bacterium]
MRRNAILVFDEHGFARVCSAILESAGYSAEVVTSYDCLPQSRECERFRLIITSHPFGDSLLKRMKKRDVSTIILCDDFNENLPALLGSFNSSYCMIKPLDYGKFRLLVKQVMSGGSDTKEGWHFVM